jgi:hypothetical protein
MGGNEREETKGAIFLSSKERTFGLAVWIQERRIDDQPVYAPFKLVL